VKNLNRKNHLLIQIIKDHQQDYYQEEINQKFVNLASIILVLIIATLVDIKVILANQV